MSDIDFIYLFQTRYVRIYLCWSRPNEGFWHEIIYEHEPILSM